MQFSGRTASTSSSARPGWGARRMDDVVYQAVTVGAILLVLGSLWVF